MRTALLIVVALALVLSAGAAYAAVSQEDGWAGPATAGGFEDGLVGDYQTNWWAVGGSNGWTGWWDGDDGVWVPTSAPGGDDGLMVTAYVELYASQSQVTEAVFHWGLPPFTAMGAVLPGTIVSNHPCYVGIRKAGWLAGDEAKASHLSFVKDFWNRPGAITDPAFDGTTALGDTSADIPISFAIKLAAGGYYAMNWSGGAGGTNYGWYSTGRLPVGTTSYAFKITATPDPYQADGKYILDPQVIVVPDL